MSRVIEIKAEIQKLVDQLDSIQADCSHPKGALKTKHGSSTGNYDPTSDSYWTDYHCTICDKKWTEDQ